MVNFFLIAFNKVNHIAFSSIHLVLAMLFLLNLESANGHAMEEDYIFVNIYQDRIEGEFQINFEDLKSKFGIEITRAQDDTLEKVQGTARQVQNYILENFEIKSLSGEPYKISFKGSDVLGKSIFARYLFDINLSSPPEKLIINHRMFYENNDNHRGLFLVQYNVIQDKNHGQEFTALIFNPDNQVQQLDLNHIPGLLNDNQMIYQGAVHIWFGWDHVLYLLALILPIILLISEQDNVQRNWQQLLFKLLTIITVFTIAHSITLTLSVLKFISINEQFVEAMIALSIIIVALNNILNFSSYSSLATIVFFGLFHGLGFASAMSNLPFRMVDLSKMLIRYNIGIELGQLLLIIVFFPALLYLRNSVSIRCRIIILNLLSIIFIIIAGYWFLQRIGYL